ncbi:MAG TPA: hypothetical protein VFB26_09680 [Gaiellaceae bacterium]|nr:hypothetical protein [Gaiellaceae bacterium]
MDVVLLPAPDPVTASAVALALRQAGLELEAVPGAYHSAWRLAGLCEAAGLGPPGGYGRTPSPRSTPGASRA